MPGSGGMVQIARVLKSNGTDGEIILSFRGIDPGEIDTTEPVFIDFDGLPVPFFFRSFYCKGANRAFAKLNDVNSLGDAEELVGKAVYSDRHLSGCEDEDEMDLTGWTLRDSEGVAVGMIAGFEDIPGNPCLVVDSGKEDTVMVPLHEDLVLGIDEDIREIIMDIPEGLF